MPIFGSGADHADGPHDQPEAAFLGEPPNLPEVVAPTAADGSHRGRRAGVRNRRTDELARW